MMVHFFLLSTETFEIPSSRTPSLHSSQEDEQDELFSVSSPNTELSPIRAIENAKEEAGRPFAIQL